VVHARGRGAHGYFENYEPLAELTRADLFAGSGVVLASEAGAADLAGSPGLRDRRLSPTASSSATPLPSSPCFRPAGSAKAWTTASSSSERPGPRPRTSWPAAASSFLGPPALSRWL
jgi:hypothetical protein